MDPDHGLDDEGPFFAWLPPEDRLWRHPSEVPAGQSGGTVAGGATVTAGPASGSGSFGGPGRVWTVALVAGLVGALAASGVAVISGSFSQRTTVIHSANAVGPAVSLASVGDSAAIDWSAIDDRLAASVVAISVSGASGPTSGSGVLLMDVPQTKQAYIVTDRSLVTGGGETGYWGDIEVTFLAGQRVRGTLVGQDPMSDLALVAVPDLQGTLAPVGSVTGLQLADPVLAMAARNSPSGSVFPGFVSGSDRQVDMAAGNDMYNMIAVSSSVGSGPVAGGPLVDRYGRVVGIAVDVDPSDSSEQNLTFAVPIDEARIVARQLLAGQKIAHPWIGVSDSADLSSSMAHKLGLSGGAQAGTVAPGSPANRLGLYPDDIITALDGAPVTSAGSLTAILSNCRLGATTTIDFIHRGQAIAATLVVSNQPYNS